MLQQDEATSPHDQWARTRFDGGGSAPVPPAWLIAGDVYRRPGLPDRIVAEVTAEQPEDADTDTCTTDGPLTIRFAPVNGAPSWHRVRTATVDAVRPADGVEIGFRAPRHVPSPFGVGEDVQRRWRGGGMFAWIPGRCLRGGDEIDTEWFDGTFRTVAAVSSDCRTVSLQHCTEFPDDDNQLHGSPDTLYWARRPVGAKTADSGPDHALAGAFRVLRGLGGRRRKFGSHG